MKKVLRIENLDCAHCAQKMEDGIAKIDGVTQVKVNFLLQKIVLDGDETKMDAIVAETIKICKKIEPDCKLLIK